MSSFGGIFSDYLNLPWEQARTFLQEELEQLRLTVSRQWAGVFDKDGVLLSESIQGDATITPRYVENSGTGNAPKWSTVDVANGVRGKLQLANFVAATVSTLLGRGSAAGTGDHQPITLGTNLSMSGTTLNATDTGITQLTGDVTAGPGSGSQVATIAADAVTYAKMQNMSAISRLLGRGSAAGVGDVQEITVGSGLTMTGTTLEATAGGGGTVTQVNTGVYTTGGPIVGAGTIEFSTLAIGIVEASQHALCGGL